MKKYKAIIFDLDGVICNTDQFHYLAWKKMADAEGIYFDETINNRLRGVSRMESLEIILEKSAKTYLQEEKNVLADRKNSYYKEFLLRMSQEDMSEDVTDSLKTLRNKGIKLAIGSSSKNAKLILKQLGITDYFDVISDGTNITNSKPDPEVFRKASELLKESPAECLVVEDALSGILAAHRGGFDSAGIGEAAQSEFVTYPIRTISDLLLFNFLMEE